VREIHVFIDFLVSDSCRTAALETIAEGVRECVRREGVGLDPERAARYVRDEVSHYSERALGGPMPRLADETDAAW